MWEKPTFSFRNAYVGILRSALTVRLTEWEFGGMIFLFLIGAVFTLVVSFIVFLISGLRIIGIPYLIPGIYLAYFFLSMFCVSSLQYLRERIPTEWELSYWRDRALRLSWYYPALRMQAIEAICWHPHSLRAWVIAETKERKLKEIICDDSEAENSCPYGYHSRKAVNSQEVTVEQEIVLTEAYIIPSDGMKRRTDFCM
ncbi:MAG: hypothetical protein WCL23_03550 [Candidatus Moraniibacteriota bacterium]